VAGDLAGDKDVALMGGRPFFQSLPAHIRLRMVEAVPAPGVTQLHYEVAK
jgi:hypothetical protein